jgi:hypothetical protein
MRKIINYMVLLISHCKVGEHIVRAHLISYYILLY